MPSTRQNRNRTVGATVAATPAVALALVLVLTIVMTQSVQAQTFNVIHNFTNGQDGANPEAGLTIDVGGNLYGTTNAGGTGYGTVFKLAHKNSGFVFNPLYSFAGGTDGAGTRSRVIFGRDGSLYGATVAGGGGSGCSFYDYTGCGTVFNLKPQATACKAALCPWTESLLYTFSGGDDGKYPMGDIVFDPAGNMYGAAYLGGIYHEGLIYSLTPSNGAWNQSVVYPFTGGKDGAVPHGFEIFDNAGNLYGTALAGGAYGYGVVFQLTPSSGGWSQSVLYSFSGGSDGGAPVAGVIFDRNKTGNLYGATIQSGSGGGGTVFELTGGNWAFNLLYSFADPTGGSVCGPQASLVMDQDGNLYGTTDCDGMYGYGSVFMLTPSGGYTSLHDFTGGSDGAYPWSNVVFDKNGNLYGTASVGGDLACNAPSGCGVVWEITP